MTDSVSGVEVIDDVVAGNLLEHESIPPALFMMSVADVAANLTPAAWAVMVCEPLLLPKVVATVCPDASIASCRAEYALATFAPVVVFVASPLDPTEQQRSGTWSTVRFARKMGKAVFLILPDGAVKRQP